MPEPDRQALLVRLTANMVSAYVVANGLAAGDLPGLIQTIYGGLAGVAQEEPGEPQRPAVTIRKSITPDHLVCLEDGLRFRSLKRHLWAKYHLTPEAYRTKWGLPKTYPMVAPAYAETRSRLAKAMGLGQGLRPATPPNRTPAAKA